MPFSGCSVYSDLRLALCYYFITGITILQSVCLHSIFKNNFWQCVSIFSNIFDPLPNSFLQIHGLKRRMWESCLLEAVSFLETIASEALKFIYFICFIRLVFFYVWKWAITYFNWLQLSKCVYFATPLSNGFHKERLSLRFGKERLPNPIFCKEAYESQMCLFKPCLNYKSSLLLLLGLFIFALFNISFENTVSVFDLVPIHTYYLYLIFNNTVIMHVQIMQIITLKYIVAWSHVTKMAYLNASHKSIVRCKNKTSSSSHIKINHAKKRIVIPKCTPLLSPVVGL